MPQSLVELRDRISDATVRIDAPTLQLTWEGFQYSFDICHITQMSKLNTYRQNLKLFSTCT